jgi:uncharacterized protein involved in exopolysaccharide biosynthesis
VSAATPAAGAAATFRRATPGVAVADANGYDGPGAAEPGAASVTVLGLLATLLESWKWLAAAGVLGAAVAAAAVLPKPRTYTASMALVTVTSSRGPTLGGVLGAAGISLGGGGIEPTPAFVLRLMKTESVRRAVALTPMPDSSRPLIAALAGGERAPRPEQYSAVVGRVVQSTLDRDGGTITLAATHSDSAVARLVAGRMLEETSRGFLRASRAQAAQLRAAQERRVEVAERNLRAAEAALLEFSRANRVLESFSVGYAQRQQLERALTLAQSVYTQAVNDRESAVAKELEDTPALVVLDPVPDTLAPNARHSAAKMIAAAFAAMLLTGLWAVARSLLLRGGAADSTRLRRAARSLPAVGRLVRG